MVLSLLQEINRTYNMTVIIITHNSLIKNIADRIITFKSGHIEEIVENDNPEDVGDIEW